MPARCLSTGAASPSRGTRGRANRHWWPGCRATGRGFSATTFFLYASGAERSGPIPGSRRFDSSLLLRKSLAGEIEPGRRTRAGNCGRKRSFELPGRAAPAVWQEFTCLNERGKGRPAALSRGALIHAGRSARFSNLPATTRWRRRSDCGAKCACSRSSRAPSPFAGCDIPAVSQLYPPSLSAFDKI